MTRKRTLGVVVGVAALAAAIALWTCKRGDKPGIAAAARGSAAGSAVASAESRWAKPRVDPNKQPRASVSGTIKAEDGAAIPGARVCATVYTNKISQQTIPDPFCTASDDKGQYTIRELFADEVSVSAMAKPFQPGVHHPKGDRRETMIQLAPGEAKTGIDIVLRKGGVEITGTVSDLTGGPIAHALVTANGGWRDYSPTPAVETDAKGAFSLWVRPGDVSVSATAEGYSSGSEDGKAPGKFELLLTPEGSLAGVVVDAASGQPVAGVPVEVGDARWGGGEHSDISDEQGKFRVTRLEPGRYGVTARGPAGYGRADGSTLVGLGQHVDGVIVKLHPGFRVSGKVVQPDKSICKKSWVWLQEEEREWSTWGQAEPDGVVAVHGLLPGTYTVSVGCSDYTSREKYEPIKIVDKNLDDLTWEVDAGATIRGRVLTKAGQPVDHAQVWGNTTGGAVRAKESYLGATSGVDGTYEIKGVREGMYKLQVDADRGTAPEDGWKVAVKAGETVEQDLILDDGGSIKGVVVDAEGKPVGSVSVRAFSTTAQMIFYGMDAPVRTNDDGTFQLDDLRPGGYRVMAMRGTWSDDLRKPGTTDDDKQGEKVTVAAGQAVTVKLVVESQSGVIKGIVIDSQGKPVQDAFVDAARESDAAGAMGSSVQQTRWSWDERPVLTSTEGKFTLTKLSPGKYTLRAHRKGGGEAVAEHVAIGATATLQIKATGSITGIAKREGGAPDDLKITLTDPKTGFDRYESYFRTGGAFVVKDLPAGNFTITATAEGGEKQVKLTLAEGEQKTGVTIELEPLVELTGRIVELGTSKPVPGIRMTAQSGKEGGFGGSYSDDEDQLHVSGEDGRFTIKRAPRGDVTLRGFPKDYNESEYSWIQTTRTVTGTGKVDIGDINTVKKRVKKGEQAGELGLHFKQSDDGTAIDQRVFEVSYIDPKGPAAKSGIKIGDVVISIDGIDVTGANAAFAWTLMRAPAGTKLELGLKRGVSVSVVLTPPD